jgi:FeS assembly SUF system protein
MDMTENNSPAPASTEATLNVSEMVAYHDKIVEKLRTVYDPEIPVNIFDLGLIYNIKVEPNADVHVKMTLTSPGCPAAGTLPGEVEDKIVVIPGIKNVKVDVVWDPTWDKEMMSEAAKLQLGFM